MHLRDEGELAALAVYEPHRSGRYNFVELKCVHTRKHDGHEPHLLRHLKNHLGRVRFSYILYQADKEQVRAYNGRNFFVIEYDLLPADVKERMPHKAGTVCMKFLLKDWQKNRFDLVKKPFGYQKS